jgi:conjugative relaxase-like TrwC/TraI family protein
VIDVLTIAKLSRWSINYYNDTANAVGRAAADARKAGGGLGEYYTEHDTRTPVWLCAGDTYTAVKLVGLTDVQRAGGQADTEVVARWLDEGVAPNGECGRAFGSHGVHGFDLTFCAPKSVSLIRALKADDVEDKAILNAHTTAISEAMEYLAAHAGYTRVHNPVTGEKDLVKLPGLVAIAYQHETSRAGDPHLHTHVVVPNRQARHDGQLVSIDGTSLYHEARAAGVIYQATLRRELHRSLGWNGTRQMPPPGWLRSPASPPRRSPRGRNAPPNYGSGRPEIWRWRTRATSRPPSLQLHRKRPDRPNPSMSPGPSCRRSGAPITAAWRSMAPRGDRLARPGAKPPGYPSIGNS